MNIFTHLLIGLKDWRASMKRDELISLAKKDQLVKLETENGITRSLESIEIAKNQESMNNSLRMYVLVNREILPLVHAGVQASHSVHEYVWKYRDNPDTKQWCEQDKTLIFLNGNKNDMQTLMTYCDKVGIKYSKFIEPDMNNEMTAVAFQPMTKIEGEILFGKFKLLI